MKISILTYQAVENLIQFKVGRSGHVNHAEFCREKIRKYQSVVVRNTVRSFRQIHLTMFEKYSKRRSDPDFLCNVMIYVYAIYYKIRMEKGLNTNAFLQKAFAFFYTFIY